MRFINRIILHCSASEDSIDIGLREIKHLHTAPKTEEIDWFGYKTHGRAWSDIGYHWIVRRDGRIEQGRDEEIQGAHVRGYNRTSIGIVWIGRTKPGIAQYKQLLKKLRGLINKYKLSPLDIYGHTELDGRKTCPNLDMDVVRADVLFQLDEI